MSGISSAVLTSKNAVRYFSGFMGSDALLIITGDQNFLLSDGRYAGVLSGYDGPFEPVIRKGELKQEFKKLLTGTEPKTGLEFSSTDISKYMTLRDLFPGKEFVQIDDSVNSVSSVMDAEALRWHKKSSDIVKKTVLKIGSEELIGKSERWIKGRIIELLYEGGADELSFDPIVATGKNSANPHHKSGNTKVRKNDVLLVDLGCSVNGVCCDITRMLTPEDGYHKEFDSLYDFVLDMLVEAGELIVPGMTGGEADKLIRDKYFETGLDMFFPHALGHGVGYDIHIHPRIGTDSPGIITEGQLLAIEPAVYFPGRYGIRIEDNFLVGSEGCENLTRF